MTYKLKIYKLSIDSFNILYKYEKHRIETLSDAKYFNYSSFFSSNFTILSGKIRLSSFIGNNCFTSFGVSMEEYIPP